jgi:phosphatidylserine decarboxylase
MLCTGNGGDVMTLPVSLARYGLREILASLLVCGGGAAALGVYATPCAAIAPGVLLLFTLYFFRDPRRVPPEGERLIVAPADGTVMDIEEVDEPEFLGGRAERVGIFLSLLSVHINRAPLAGRVGYMKYRPGRFFAAFNERASVENESNMVGLETDMDAPSGGKLKVAVKQISGVIARRIVCACKETERLARGEKFGMIKFGSRTEVYLPPGAAELTVSVGDKVRAGRTVIGRVVARAGAGANGPGEGTARKDGRP